MWLDEGWADVFSTLKPWGKKSMVGDLIPGRVQVLQREDWMSFEDLTSVGLHPQLPMRIIALVSLCESCVDQPAAFDVSLMSADLSAVTNQVDRAKSEYAALAMRNPDRPEIPQSLGYLAWQKRDTELARSEFEESVRRG